MERRFRQTLRPAVTKSPDSSKSDINLIWSGPLSPFSSPNAKSSCANADSDDFFSLIAGLRKKSPHKMLARPPIMDDIDQEKVPPPVADFMLSQVVYTSPNQINIVNEVRDSVVFAFSSKEHQNDAWESAKKIIGTTDYVVVSCAHVVMSVMKGQVTLKALTGSAQKHLKAVAESSNGSELDRCLKLFDGFADERMSIYSSERFNYSVVTPIVIEESTYLDRSTKSHMTKLSGFIFPRILSIIEDANDGLNKTVVKCL